jgi:hypothetical protein
LLSVLFPPALTEEMIPRRKSYGDGDGDGDNDDNETTRVATAITQERRHGIAGWDARTRSLHTRGDEKL